MLIDKIRQEWNELLNQMGPLGQSIDNEEFKINKLPTDSLDSFHDIYGKGQGCDY